MTAGNEVVGSDGGFAVPPEWHWAIMAAVVGEAAIMTKSNLALKDMTVKLHRVTALVPVTDERKEAP